MILVISLNESVGTYYLSKHAARNRCLSFCIIIQ